MKYAAKIALQKNIGLQNKETKCFQAYKVERIIQIITNV